MNHVAKTATQRERVLLVEAPHLCSGSPRIYVLEAPAFMRGKEALALCERVSTLIMRFSAGNANASLVPAFEIRRRKPIRSLGPEGRPPDVSPARQGWDTVPQHPRAPGARHCLCYPNLIWHNRSRYLIEVSRPCCDPVMEPEAIPPPMS